MADSHQSQARSSEKKSALPAQHQAIGPERTPQTGQAGLTLQRLQTGAADIPPNEVLQLQRLAGNRAVQRLLQPQRGSGTRVQRKLEVGPADDKYEREADRMAAQVMRMPTPSPKKKDEAGGQVQRRIQRAGGEDGFEVGKDFQRSLESSGGGKPLPTDLRREFEPKFGADFSGVRVHTGPKASEMSQQIQAKAFTHGSDIYMGGGQYNPGSSSGKGLLAHELTHTIQQGGAGVQRQPSLSSAQTGQIQRFKWPWEPSDAQVQERKKVLDNVRHDVLLALMQDNWAGAINKFKKLNYTYSSAGWWGQTKGAKYMRDTLGLNTYRKEAKGLIPKRDKGDPKTVTQKISSIAQKTRTNSKPENFSEGNLKQGIKAVQKITHYLIEAIPTQIRSFAESFSTVDLDLDDVLSSDLKDAPDRPKTQKVKGDEALIKQAITGGTMDDRGFHGSASWLLEGLGKSGGKLLSQKRAFEMGLLKTGEGTAFSSGADLKTNVYIGKGSTGFGTAASYGLAPEALTTYNVTLFSDVELAQTIQSYQRILKLEASFLSLTDGTGRNVINERILEMAKKAGIDPKTDPGFAHLNKGLQNTVQLEDMLSKLLKEKKARESWPKEDPRRGGGMLNPDNYPILLEFSLDKVETTDDLFAQSRIDKGDYRLAGEATVENELDLSERLKVVYCPEKFIEKTKQKLKDVFGDENGIEVRAIEAIRGGITGDAEKSLTATYGQLQKQEKVMDIKMKAHKSLTEKLPEGPDSFKGTGGRTFEKRKARGGETGYAKTSGASLAKDKAAEEKAIAFEQKLGDYAYRHPKANSAALNMSGKVMKYLDERKKLVEKLSKKEQEAFKGADAYDRIGEFSKKMAGGVGTEIEDIKAVLTGGNLRERMTHLYKFGSAVLDSDMKLKDKKDQVQKILQAADFDEGESGKMKEIPQDEIMDQRDNTRFYKGGDTKSDVTAGQLKKRGIGLTSREQEMTGAKGDDSKVGWNEGAKMWLMNESNEWVRAQRAMSIPIMAGPSSHTHAFMRLAKAMKYGNLTNVRLAAIGHLLPIRAHSLIEVLVAANAHGVPYTKGKNMYKDIKPLSEGELRRKVAIGGKFPFE